MPTLAFYPNKFSLTPLETAHCEPGITLERWLTANVPTYTADGPHPISVMLNGELVLPMAWSTLELKEGDQVAFIHEPKDFITPTVIYIMAAAAAAAAVVMTQQSLPDNYNSSVPKGSSIYEANVQGNRPKLMGVIPQIFGTHKTYFDMLAAPHWYYSNDDEYLMMFCCVGKGHYHLPMEKLTIGNTPLSAYAGDVDVEVFEPNTLVTSHPAHKNTYTSPEIGATAGTSGIELEGPVNDITPVKSVFAGKSVELYQDLDGFTVAYWPTEWEPGQRIEIEGMPGAFTLYGGEWRGEADTSTLNYWTQNESQLHTCRKGDYVLYPQSGQNNTLVWRVGTVDAIFYGYVNSTRFYAIRILDSSGNRLDIDSIPSAYRDEPFKALGRDNGYYRISSVSPSSAVLQKLHPNASSSLSSWGGFSHNGEYKGASFRSLNTFSGKIVGPIRVTPPKQTTNKIMVDVRFKGLGYTNDSGNMSAITVEIMLEWREVGTSTWKQVSFARTGATRDELGNTIEIDLGKQCEPEFRCYRVTNKETDARYLDTVEIIRVKSELRTPVRYKNMTTIALRIRGTNALSHTAEKKFAGEPTRKLQVPDGKGGWTIDLHPTNDIAPVIRYIAQECDFTDEMINQQSLLRLHDVWKARGDEFHAVFDSATTHFEAQRRVMSCGFAQPTLDFGQLIAVRDEPRSGRAYMYGPDNMTSPLKISIANHTIDEHDCVEVEYFDENTWKPATILCKLPDSQGYKPKKLKAFGIKNRIKAYQWGMRRAAEMRYRRKTYTWSTELDGLNSTFLSRADLGWPVPGYGNSGRVSIILQRTSYLVIRTNAELNWEEGQQHVISLRRPDGTTFGPVNAEKGAGVGEVIIRDKLDFEPCFDGTMEPPYFMFGTQTNWRLPALVQDITPDGTNKVTLKAVNDDARVFEWDDAIPPAELMKGYV
ncbi:host specificity factor TipJ family phage tail protein [Grimontia hollisae]|uniref:host specificity factor TipJ family phage tail protein n=1 Tax=Grimontia hollisae TaxID=673 RepID=UPI000E007215|nr:host specificity factor TipJ family phage tail protein [Grimontia hollisae]STQ75547.1 Uncharacterised protein [Grimontia hollisae]